MRTLALFLLFATAAYAQERAIMWTITRAEAEAILNKVGELPWKDSNPLMQKLIAQTNEQLRPPQPEPPTPEK